MLKYKHKKYMLLFIVIFLFLWLIVNIPFFIKPAYSKIIAVNPAVEDFLNLKFALITFSVALLSIILFNFKKEFVLKYRAIIVFSSSFIYTSFRVLKTFDVTDTGHHFTKAWGLWHGSTAENIDFRLGTSFIHGLWLSLYGEPSVLWARLGFVIVISMIILFSYKIYNLYFNGLRYFLIFMSLIFFFIHFNYYYSINYDNLPLLSTLIGTWFILKSDDFKYKNYIVSGTFYSLAIWMKFNYFLIVSLPFILFLYYYINKDADRFKKLLSLLSGYAIIILSGIIILFGTGYLTNYSAYLNERFILEDNKGVLERKISEERARFGQSSSIDIIKSSNPDSYYFLNDSLKKDSLRNDGYYKFDDDSHEIKAMFNDYFAHLWSFINISLQYLFLFLLVFVLFSYRLKSKIVKAVIIAGFSFYLYYAAYISLIGSDFIFISALVFCGYIFYIVQKPNKQELQLQMPFIIIILISVYSFPGSNLSFNVIYRSGAGLLLMAFPIAYLFDKNICLGKCAFKFHYYSVIMVLFVILSTFKSWGYNNSHRDLKDRRLLITMFKTPQLFGVHTTPQRVQVIDGLIAYFNNENYVRNATPALFLGWIPTMYYLTQTNCITNDPWHECETFKIFQPEFDKASKTKQPVYIVFTSKFTRNDSWPLLDDDYKKKDKSWLGGLRMEDYIRYWMKDKNYKQTFKNEMFEVYKLQK